jgi:nucleoside-triphosphatase
MAPVKILLTGVPGCGKTTAIQRALSRLVIDAGGFFTQEIREVGVRKGFKIITLDGREGVLAHVNIIGRPRVGKYGVNLVDLDEIGVGSIKQAIRERELVVIDEIGPMELYSTYFRQAVLEALEGNVYVLGTIARRGNPFCDAIKVRPDVTLIEIDRTNREQVVERVIDLIQGRAI